MKQITRYQPASADLIDPMTHGLNSREVATFVLGAVALRLTAGLRTGFSDEVAERSAAAVLSGTDDTGDPTTLANYFTGLWGRLVEQVQSDRAINARLKEMGPVNVYQPPSE